MEKHLEIASSLAHVLDNQFRIGRLRFGYASLLNVIPAVGDTIDALLSLYIVWIAILMRASPWIILRMGWNIFINFLIGLIPIYGDIIYLIRKVNITNVELLKQHVANHTQIGKIIS